MKLDLNFESSDNTIAVNFASADESISSSFLESYALFAMYDGEYTVTPSANDDKTLLTAGKTMTKNLKVEKIPFSEVTNTQGGTTVNIG